MQPDTQKKLHNGVAIPTVGLGVFQIENGPVAEKAIRSAIDAGYRHIDTARAYHNEESVGKAVRNAGIPRDEIFVTTKLWNADIRAGRARAACEESLSRLGLDYIDLYLIHWPADGFEVAWSEMETLYREGKLRAIGVSNFQDHHINTLMQNATITPMVNQIECHPLLTQKPLREYCESKGIACEAWSPLGGTGGNLLDHSALAAIAQRYGKSVAQIILRWDIQGGLITLPKSVHPDRIASNINIYDFELSAEDMAAIDSLNQDRRVGPDPDHFNF